ncbi:hypothetical protein AVDCRST_MAG84-445 [uncultured Microcoleus sp.]|uniref:Uncharacterized protein n=1 Tax=uncultured Microcoleus sp. TaxID=259945 RepID=A0A6J4KHB1_9CYAN|nr:hypothetical protein AVDCRST_MAG84-445 [uncultured Microcoleus sp.]
MLSFGCEFLKFASISCFLFLWVVNRVSLDPVEFWGPAALGTGAAGGRCQA